MSWYQQHHMTRSHITHSFDQLVLKNAMVPVAVYEYANWHICTWHSFGTQIQSSGKQPWHMLMRLKLCHVFKWVSHYKYTVYSHTTAHFTTNRSPTPIPSPLATFPIFNDTEDPDGIASEVSIVIHSQDEDNSSTDYNTISPPKELPHTNDT